MWIGVEHRSSWKAQDDGHAVKTHKPWYGVGA